MVYKINLVALGHVIWSRCDYKNASNILMWHLEVGDETLGKLYLCICNLLVYSQDVSM